MLVGKLSKNDTKRMQGSGQLNKKVHSDANTFWGRTAFKANLATAVFHFSLENISFTVKL